MNQYAKSTQQYQSITETDKRLAAVAKEPPCSACQSTGVYILWHKIKKRSYAFQCTCQFGIIMRPSYPRLPFATKDYISYSKRDVKEFAKKIQKQMEKK